MNVTRSVSTGLLIGLVVISACSAQSIPRQGSPTSAGASAITSAEQAWRNVFSSPSSVFWYALYDSEEKRIGDLSTRVDVHGPGGLLLETLCKSSECWLESGIDWFWFNLTTGKRFSSFSLGKGESPSSAVFENDNAPIVRRNEVFKIKRDGDEHITVPVFSGVAARYRWAHRATGALLVGAGFGGNQVTRGQLWLIPKFPIPVMISGSFSTCGEETWKLVQFGTVRPDAPPAPGDPAWAQWARQHEPSPSAAPTGSGLKGPSPDPQVSAVSQTVAATALSIRLAGFNAPVVVGMAPAGGVALEVNTLLAKAILRMQPGAVITGISYSGRVPVFANYATEDPSFKSCDINAIFTHVMSLHPAGMTKDQAAQITFFVDRSQACGASPRPPHR